MKTEMAITRRTLLSACSVMPAASALAQGGSPFVGEWAGQVEGIGAAKIVITGVTANGRVSGRMEFALNSFTSTFSDKATAGPPPTSRGMVSAGLLSIEAALGGNYELFLSGNRLSGSYVRGTTLRSKAEFTRQ